MESGRKTKSPPVDAAGGVLEESMIGFDVNYQPAPLWVK